MEDLGEILINNMSSTFDEPAAYCHKCGSIEMVEFGSEKMMWGDIEVDTQYATCLSCGDRLFPYDLVTINMELYNEERDLLWK